MTALEQLQTALCVGMCADVRLHERPDGRLRVDTPFLLPDGDRYSIYLQRLPSGGMRLTDAGQTLMHLSYEMDVDNLREGVRGRLLEQILGESPVAEDDGELVLDSPIDDLGRNLFVFGQTITRFHDLSLWRRQRVAATFYEDLDTALRDVYDPNRIQRNYIVPTVPHAEDYPVDFLLEPKEETRKPLFLFGIPSAEKAKLATIIIQYLTMHEAAFESLLVFQNQEEIPRRDLARLSNVGGEMVASLDAHEDLRRKVLKRVA
jgi:hypothetical protein